MNFQQIRQTARRRSLRVSSVAVAVIAASTLTAASVGAVPTSTNTYYVGTTADDAGTAMPATCAMHTNKTCTLRDAIVTANTDGLGSIDTIVFTSLPSYSTVTLNSANGPLSVTDTGTLKIMGSGAEDTYISGGHATRVITTSASDLRISNLGIENGFWLGSTGGGGIYNTGSLTLTNVNVEGNVTAGSSTYGGGVYSAGSLSVNGGEFSTNSANTCGGAFYIRSGPSPSLNKVNILHNVSDCGGGVYNYSGVTLSITNSTIAFNYARDYDDGGGIEQHGTLYLTNDTLANNTSTEYGGALANENGATSYLQNVTVDGNNALQAAGGIYNNHSGNLYVRGSILEGNTVYGNVPSQCFGYGPTTSQGYNVVTHDSDANCNFHAPGDRTNALDQYHGALGSYGGATQTIPIILGSPAILLEPHALCPSTDQRGVARPSNCDAGAFELAPSKSSLACGSVVGRAPGVVTISGCTPANATAKSATGSMSVLSSGGGTLTWHPSNKATVVSVSWTSPGKGACGTGRSEFDVAGVVTASSASNAHYFDKVSGRICVNNATSTVALVTGTKLQL